MVNQDRSLAVRVEQNALVVANPQLQGLAKHLGWKPETAIMRIERALPARLEQNLYLTVMAENPVVRPETFAKLLRHLNGGQELRDSDMNDRTVGENLTSNRFVDVGDLLGIALSLIEWGKEYGDVGIGSETAACLAQAYGEHAEAMLDMIQEHFDIIAEALNMGTVSRPRVLAGFIKAIAFHAANGDKRGGVPNAVSLDEVIAILSNFAQSPDGSDEDEEEENQQ